MKSSNLAWMIMAALPVGSDQHAASTGLLKEKPLLQARKAELALSFFETKDKFDEEEEDGFDNEEEDEMVSSTYILKSFCALSLELSMI